MHQELVKVPKGMVIDHIDHDGLDNRKANLRPATRCQNMYHRKKTAAASRSKYKGVSRRKNSNKWLARIRCEKKSIYLGTFASEIDAAKAYDRAAKKYHGEFASLNFPESAGGRV